MTGSHRRWVGLVAGVLLAPLLTGVAGCAGQPKAASPAPAVTAKLSASVPAGLKIGVVVSSTSPLGEGSEWRGAAQGAEVAAARFALGGTPITLVPANDKGTADGATSAVDSLAAQGVAGIVLATSGDHLAAAVAEASSRNVPALLPYATSADRQPAHVWATGPLSAAIDGSLAQAARDRDLTRPYLIDAGGGTVDGITPVGSQSFGVGDDAAEVAKQLAKARHSATQHSTTQHSTTQAAVFDSVVVTGPAALQGRLVAALQGVGIDVPVLLGPDALSPAFPQAIATAGGSLAGTLLSAGLDNGDARALEPTDAGRALAGYFSALNLTASDPKATDLFGQQPFSAVAAEADVRSHDAVVAIVRAAAAAGSADPARVADALAGLHPGVADGLAGPPLDFSAPAAVAATDVRPLAATSVSPGVRTMPTGNGSGAGSGSDDADATAGVALYWYSVTPPS